MADDGDRTTGGPEAPDDESPYRGVAEHYAVGRAAYPPGLADALVGALPLDGGERLLDVGCGPGSFALLLAPHVAEVVGVDADAAMLATAARLAAERGLTDVRWHHLRAEDLPADLPPADVISFAQSLHWTDRARVLPAARAMLRPGGAVLHVRATTHRGRDDGVAPDRADAPAPPWPAVTALVAEHLRQVPGTGSGVRRARGTGGEAAAFRAAGLRGPQRVVVPGWTTTRTTEQVVSAVLSLSTAAPALLGARLPAFDADLRALLAGAAPDGRFTERMRGVEVDVWR